MKQYIFAVGLMVCAGCGGESLTSGPNPLETYDQDRLYVLINAAVNRTRAAECASYFQEADNQAADNPGGAFSGALLSQVCPESMVKIAAYLEHNGVAGVKAAHVKDLALWERIQTKYEGAAEERKQEQEEREAGRLKRAQAKAEARRQCREKVDSENKQRNLRSSRPLRTDFPDHKAWKAGRDEWAAGALERMEEYRAARGACDSVGRAGGLFSEEPSGPSLEELGISLPEGMRVNGVGRIN